MTFQFTVLVETWFIKEVYWIKVSSEDTVNCLKEKIKKSAGIPVEQ